ncbi:MAG: TMEM165/GDT1 family protein [Oscillatoriaceae bacterium SKW80]|nr:TMEM165/GDT1 family protein [Oscillatoriaceae bacterium SKYG93]MCX8119283.1 TMEM165/GDT1 family protein [Oscillatoriaceae bacterium SKW80]MDW8454750.1 TMEM165/GDT1 family protein [Oscillatoriaceae cyanobacterium SKYGB_i_bin93]
MKTSTLPAHLPDSESLSLKIDAPEASFALERLETKDCPDTTAPANETGKLSGDTQSSPDYQPLKQIKQSSIWGVFASTFATIFLAEMGDKTQIATLLMTAESHSPWIVFLGAGSALIATSLLGVLLGCWLAGRLSPKVLETAAGTILLFISASLLWDVLH